MQILGRLLEQIPFNAQVAEERHCRAQVLACRTMRRMRRARSHMLAHHFGRHQKRRIALNVGAFHRIDAIGGPDAIGVAQDSQIHASSAGRAAFNLEPWVREFQVMEDSVHGKRLPVHCGTAGARRHSFGDQPVMVPFDVVDAQFANQAVHGAEHIVVGIRIRQVDDLLGTPLQRQACRGGAQHPIRMLAKRLGIRIHHLRLEPQAELHALAMHVIRQRLEAVGSVRPDVLRNPPVAQARSVVPP